MVLHILFSLTVSSKDGAKCVTRALGGYHHIQDLPCAQVLVLLSPVRVSLVNYGVCLALLNCFNKPPQRQKRGEVMLYSGKSIPNPVVLPHTLPNIMMFNVCGARPNPPPQTAYERQTKNE